MFSLFLVLLLLVVLLVYALRCFKSGQEMTGANVGKLVQHTSEAVSILTLLALALCSQLAPEAWWKERAHKYVYDAAAVLVAAAFLLLIPPFNAFIKFRKVQQKTTTAPKTEMDAAAPAKSKWTLVVVSIVVALLVGGGAWAYVVMKRGKAPPTATGR
ncbi:MAG TPA: hypothetical protein VF950_09675 [Planctomycetota bacterium]